LVATGRWLVDLWRGLKSAPLRLAACALLLAAGVLCAFVAWPGAAASVITFALLLAVSAATAKEAGQLAPRLRWLLRKFTDGRPNKAEFSPEAYVQLVRILRSQGRFDEARVVASHRLDLERDYMTFWGFRPALWLFAVFFDYGLSTGRALLTFFLCLFLGWAGAEIADQGRLQLGGDPRMGLGRPLRLRVEQNQLVIPNRLDWKPAAGLPILVIASTPVSAVAAMNSKTRVVQPAYSVAEAGRATNDELRCGDAIDPFLYALETFVPALELHQGSKCEISARPDAAPWRWAKALYAILGWIVTSLTVLTITGVLRRQAET
jgi:hypothetical protein